MAFLPPEQENNNAPQGVTSSTPQQMAGMPPPQSGGSTGAGGGATKAGGAPSTGSPTQFGSSASKLGDYLTANAPQITNQANTVSGQLNNAYGQISGDITNAANQFGQSVQQGYVAPNQDLVNQAAANPTGFASNPNNVSGFQAQYNDSYTGPQNYESTTPYGNIQSEVSNAVQNAGAFNTQAGLQNYFQGQGGNQTQASNTLDSLLLQGNPQAQQQIQTAANQYNNLNPQFQNSVTQADALVPAAQQAAQNAQQYAQSQIGNTANQFNTNLQNTLANDTTNANAYNTGVQNYQTGVGQTQAVNSQISNLAQLLGVQNPLNQTYNTIGLPTSANAASAQDYAESNALSQLLGSNYTPQLSQANASQAGTYNIPGAAPTAPNVANLLDQLALTDYTKNEVGGNGVPALPLSQQSGTNASAGLSMFAPNQFSNYNTQVQPLLQLLQSLNTNYGNKYVEPVKYNNNPIAGTYELNQ